MAISTALHALLLLFMGLWYFAPVIQQAPVLTGRLAGSEMGVEDGMELLGGLNTPIELTPAPEVAPEATFASMSPLKLDLPVSPDALGGASSARVRSGGGGFENENPGAGNGDGFGLARFGQGGELIRGVEVKVGDPQFTLIWDTPVDLDLHVIEPGGKEIYWESPRGTRGGELDVDNTKGYGPENVYWLQKNESTGEMVKGSGPPGSYRWYVMYWGGFGGRARPTSWKVRIKHAGKVVVVSGRLRDLNEKSRMYTLDVQPSEPSVSMKP
ncbi:MAG: hypothetical protein U0794_15770 [Isosphaeraceae bacterium]